MIASLPLKLPGVKCSSGFRPFTDGNEWTVEVSINHGASSNKSSSPSDEVVAQTIHSTSSLTAKTSVHIERWHHEMRGYLAFRTEEDRTHDYPARGYIKNFAILKNLSGLCGRPMPKDLPGFRGWPRPCFKFVRTFDVGSRKIAKNDDTKLRGIVQIILLHWRPSVAISRPLHYTLLCCRMARTK